MKNIFELNSINYKNILSIESLKVPKHKITCIVGESGSGKTTLLKMFNKMLSPDKGDIEYKGKNIKDIDSVKLRREIVMLGQSPITIADTIKDDLIMALQFSEKTVLEDSVLKDYLDMVELDKELGQDVSNLSGGEKQRLALARVLLLDPEVLLLDEPSSALDEDTERLVIQKIKQYVNLNNKTLIMVTHSKHIAKQYGENIVKIKDGKLKKET